MEASTFLKEMDQVRHEYASNVPLMNKKLEAMASDKILGKWAKTASCDGYDIYARPWTLKFVNGKVKTRLYDQMRIATDLMDIRFKRCRDDGYFTIDTSMIHAIEIDTDALLEDIHKSFACMKAKLQDVKHSYPFKIDGSFFSYAIDKYGDELYKGVLGCVSKGDVIELACGLGGGSYHVQGVDTSKELSGADLLRGFSTIEKRMAYLVTHYKFNYDNVCKI